jgi:hypothetical protein
MLIMWFQIMGYNQIGWFYNFRLGLGSDYADYAILD